MLSYDTCLNNLFFSCKGPTKLSNCANLSLSGIQSFGSGGRAPIFKWFLISPSSDLHFGNISDILSALNNDTDRVHIPGGLLTPRTKYTFELRMANFLNPAAFENVTHSVEKVDAPVPLLSLSSSIDLEKGEAFVSQNLVIKVTVVVSITTTTTLLLHKYKCRNFNR